jgi:hypothetical protein
MKIAYFDYWTAGIQNFKLIDLKLNELGHETLLLHVGSFNSPHLKEEIVDGIKCRDISFFGTRMIYKMLENERPDILITLNTTSILDRAVTLSCRHLKIATIYLMHGHRNFGDSNADVVRLFENSYNSFIKKIKRIPKYLSIVIPNYVFALYRYNSSNIINLRFLKVIYAYFKNPGKSLYYPEYTDELIQDKCLVYSKNEGKYYQQLNYHKSNIHVVGNPKSDSLLDMIVNCKFTPDMLPHSVRELLSNKKKYALFLEEAIPEQNNIGGYTAEVREQFIFEIAKRLEEEKLKLVVKLHPGTRIESITTRHENLIIEQNHLDSLIYYSEFCITNMSTTINHCVLMEKPVLAPKWNAAKNLPSFFSNIGISNCWNSINEPINLAINTRAREEYIEEFITITQPDAVDNIVREIIKTELDRDPPKFPVK